MSAMTSETLEPNNWTMVLAIPWYQLSMYRATFNIKFLLPYKGGNGHPDLWGFGDVSIQMGIRSRLSTRASGTNR
jgi:hypothetical protein